MRSVKRKTSHKERERMMTNYFARALHRSRIFCNWIQCVFAFEISKNERKSVVEWGGIAIALCTLVTIIEYVHFRMHECNDVIRSYPTSSFSFHYFFVFYETEPEVFCLYECLCICALHHHCRPTFKLLSSLSCINSNTFIGKLAISIVKNEAKDSIFQLLQNHFFLCSLSKRI